MSGGNFCYTSGVLTALAEDIEETFKKYEEDYVNTSVLPYVAGIVKQLKDLEAPITYLDKLIGGDIGLETFLVNKARLVMVRPVYEVIPEDKDFIQALVRNYTNGESSGYVRRSKNGRQYFFGYINEYSLQHGKGEEWVLPVELVGCLRNMLNINNGDN